MTALDVLTIFGLLIGALLTLATVVAFDPFAGPRDRRLDRDIEVDAWAQDLVARGEREWSEAVAPYTWSREALARMTESEAATLVTRVATGPVGARTVLGMPAYNADDWGDATSPYPPADPHARTIAAHPETRVSDDLYARPDDTFGGAW